MTPYARLDPTSPIVSFEDHGSSITVRFDTGYDYTYDTTGNAASIISEMISRAHAGKGLAAYIAQHKPH